MPRNLVFCLLLVVAVADRALSAQSPTGSAAPGVALDPLLSASLRGQLSAGYGQRREPSGILQPSAPDRPIVRLVPAIPQAVSVLAQGPSASRCPMPVAKVDPRALATMPVARADSTRLEPMPVARSACVNQLDSK
jgi:hypothetical protein